jgi:hypothetical protein
VAIQIENIIPSKEEKRKKKKKKTPYCGDLLG